MPARRDFLKVLGLSGLALSLFPSLQFRRRYRDDAPMLNDMIARGEAIYDGNYKISSPIYLRGQRLVFHSCLITANPDFVGEAMLVAKGNPSGVMSNILIVPPGVSGYAG